MGAKAEIQIVGQRAGKHRNTGHCHVHPFYLSITRALKARMSEFQCLSTLVAELNRLENRLFLANVTMPFVNMPRARVKPAPQLNPGHQHDNPERQGSRRPCSCGKKKGRKACLRNVGARRLTKSISLMLMPSLSWTSLGRFRPRICAGSTSYIWITPSRAAGWCSKCCAARASRFQPHSIRRTPNGVGRPSGQPMEWIEA